MKPINGHILVRVDRSQNKTMFLGESEILTARQYSENFREKTPVVCTVLEGLGEIKYGWNLVCQYNHFAEESPFLLYDDHYSIPLDELIIARILYDGSVIPLFGNILCQRIEKKSLIPIPSHLRKPEISKVINVFDTGNYKAGQLLLTLNYADYEIFFVWRGKEYRYNKIHKSEIVGYEKILV